MRGHWHITEEAVDAYMRVSGIRQRRKAFGELVAVSKNATHWTRLSARKEIFHVEGSPYRYVVSGSDLPEGQARRLFDVYHKDHPPQQEGS